MISSGYHTAIAALVWFGVILTPTQGTLEGSNLIDTAWHTFTNNRNSLERKSHNRHKHFGGQCNDFKFCHFLGKRAKSNSDSKPKCVRSTSKTQQIYVAVPEQTSDNIYFVKVSAKVWSRSRDFLNIRIECLHMWNQKWLVRPKAAMRLFTTTDTPTVVPRWIWRNDWMSVEEAESYQPPSAAARLDIVGEVHCALGAHHPQTSRAYFKRIMNGGIELDIELGGLGWEFAVCASCVCVFDGWGV